MLSYSLLCPVSKTAKAMPPASIVVGLPITMATDNFDAYKGVIDTMSFMGVAAAYNLYFDRSFSLGISGGVALSLKAVNPAYIGGGLSLNYIITGGGSTDIQGDFLSMSDYPTLTSYAGIGFAAKQFDFSGQVAANETTIVPKATDIDIGVFYGLMIVGGANWNFTDNMIAGAEFHYIFNTGSNPLIDPISGIMEIILGVGYMI